MKYSSFDVVVWNGIICTYSTITNLVDRIDFLRLADASEVWFYLKNR
jgi:hypothetical protein